jgi:hypothetical protein
MKGQELFFVNGTLGYWTATNRCYYKANRLCFVVAIGAAAVRLVSEYRREFRRIAGWDELAAFSIYRLPDFAALVRKERGDRRRSRENGGKANERTGPELGNAG